jgi:hypothetical protein
MTMMLGCELNASIDWIKGPSVAVKLSVSRWMRRACSCLVQIQNGRSTYWRTWGVTSWRKIGDSDRICANKPCGKPSFQMVGSERSKVVSIQGSFHSLALCIVSYVRYPAREHDPQSAPAHAT